MEYILYDVDKIKDFVFDSYRPKEVKGASEFIKALDYDPKTKKKETLLQQLMDEYPDITEESIIYSKGGSGLITSNQNQGQDICKWLEDNFRKHTLSGSLTAVYHKEEASFDTTMDILNFKGRERKSEKGMTKELDITVFDKEEKNHCGACGKRNSITTVQIGDEQIPYCDSCYDKRQLSQNKKKSKSEADSLEDICKESILTIYGDLNEAGKHLSSIKEKKELKEFSEGIFEILDETRHHIETRLEAKGFQFLAPVVGGDDMLFFTHPASFPIFLEELRLIEEALFKRLGKPMKMNFAFLLSKPNFPIYHIFQLAQSLLDQTKDAYYKIPSDCDKTTYYGLFKVFEGGHNPSEKDVYPVHQFHMLLEIAKRMNQDKKIHTSILFNLLDLLSDKYSEAERELNVLYFLARHREFESYIESSPPNFVLLNQGAKIQLTSTVLEDIILLLQELVGHENKSQEVS